MGNDISDLVTLTRTRHIGIQRFERAGGCTQALNDRQVRVLTHTSAPAIVSVEFIIDNN